jgi:DNA-binding SARP family transcriptional activator
MPPLSVRLFGKFCVQRHEKVVIGIEACKLQELFSYLLIFRSSPHPRESLAGLLWGDSSTSQSKKYLRQALWQLQSALAPPGKGRGRFPVLSVDPDSVSLNPMREVWLDVAEFERVFSIVKEVAGQHLDPELAKMVEQAVELYRGDLLEGWYQDWCLCERERLQSHYLIMLDKLLSYCEASHKFDTGLNYGLRVLRYDRARESTHRRLMRLYYLAGDRTAALRQYEHCADALNEELGVKPAKRTVALYEQMRADQFEGLKPSLTTVPNAPSRADSPPVSEVMERLRQLRALLSDIHRQVQKEIQAVDLVLNGRR